MFRMLCKSRHLEKEIAYLMSNHSFPPFSSPWQSPFCFLCLIRLFSGFYMDDIVQYVTLRFFINPLYMCICHSVFVHSALKDNECVTL